MARITPGAGRPVRGSTTGRPVMAALDLLGRRWALRILWELRDGELGFRELQARCGISPAVLVTRLGELRDAGLVEQDAQTSRYTTTPIGAELQAALRPLIDWSRRWAAG